MAGDIARGDYVISTDKARLNTARIHDFLSRSYWSPGIPLPVVQRAIDHSICFGVFRGCEQVGFARVITDCASFAYLADVFVVQEHRGKGLGKWLIQVILDHDDLQGLRRFLLATRDAHALYRRFGFAEVAQPSRLMEIHKPDAYGIDAERERADAASEKT
jgi:GNAT superfamily N-acetyltransferase